MVNVGCSGVCGRSVDVWMASFKWRGHEWGIDSGSMSMLSLTDSSILGEHRQHRRASSNLLVPSIRPLHHGAYAGVVMCLTSCF